jgi:AraC-like DNA-binding protein
VVDQRRISELRHLRRARDLADRCYAEPLTVRSLARAAHYSEAHFARAFRDAYGESPHRYLVARRLERAALLLRTTDEPIAAVADAVGFRSPGSFATRFAREMGCPPGAYRRRIAAPPGVPSCVVRAGARLSRNREVPASPRW